MSAENTSADAQRVVESLRTNLSRAESELLQRIDQGVPAAVQKRYDELIARRREETLTPQEYTELIDLTHQVEMLEAERVQALVNLARLRGVSLDQLVQSSQ
jgi:hypothetical protein